MYDFDRNQVPGETEREHGYWRDVGTLDAYYQASMDLVSVEPIFNLYNMDWPILTWHFPHPPAKFVHEAATGQGGHSTRWSLTAPWCRVDWSGVRSCHRDAGSTPMPWWRTPCSSKTSGAAGTRS